MIGKKLKGFTLMELVMVVAVIAIIAAISIPGILDSKKSANEASAIQYMRTWGTAQEIYYRKNGIYADSDEKLVDLITVTKGDGDGYSFSVDTIRGVTWFGRGSPISPGISGDRHFYISMSGVIRYAHKRPANLTDTPIK
jgi:prepilin-type N-terminal cleavage/methylation domain-containing protein